VRAGQVADERFQIADRPGPEDPLDPLGVLVGGEAALGEGLAEDVRDAVAVGVGGAEFGGGGCGLLLKVHGSSVAKHDRSR
jgi:hypothetical protein